MIAMNTKVQLWFDSLEQKKDIALVKADNFYQALSNLQYEGKVSLGRNLKEIEQSMKFFKSELSEHIKLDEEVLFPFLMTRVPKLDPMLRFLSAEHNELKSKFKIFLNLFNHVRSSVDPSLMQNDLFRLRDEGTYLFCLLRNHFQSENAGVYQVMDRELKQNEKISLLRLCARAHK